MKYKKTLAELEKVAVKWWPKNLEEEVAKISPIPILLETQDKFISILNVSGKSPESVLSVLAASDIAPNVFLKHLAILSDYGGEPIQRLGREFKKIFPENKDGSRSLNFTFGGVDHEYKFKALPINSLNNKKLRIDGVSLVRPAKFDDLTSDMIMLLLFGGASQSSESASLDRCEIGGLIGKRDEIEKYVKQKYLFVSRITTGANTNTIGQIAQTYVCNYLSGKLDKSYSCIRNGKIKLVSYDKVDGMPFDVVVSRKKSDGTTCKVGIEVSFQVTSNSVIERKSSNADDRLKSMKHEGFYIAYVLDGAGNFSRSAALNTLCQYSDCTVAYSDKEFDVLVDFIKGKLDDSVR